MAHAMKYPKTNTPNPILFSEEQYFRQWWLLLILLIVCVLPAYSAIQHLLFHHPVGNPTLPDAGAWSVLAFGLGVPVLLGFANLSTEVRPSGLYVRFLPFHFRFKKLEDIEQAKACTYRPLAEYGGWGIRYGKSGKAYNVSGNQGVLLTLKSGKTLLIGSQRPSELESAILTTLNR